MNLNVINMSLNIKIIFEIKIIVQSFTIELIDNIFITGKLLHYNPALIYRNLSIDKNIFKL